MIFTNQLINYLNISRVQMSKSDKILKKGTNIFNPQAKVVANADRVVEFIETGNTID